jgi:hypothetical protein
VSGVPAAVDAVFDVGTALLGSLIDPRRLQELLARASDDDGRTARLADAVDGLACRGSAPRAVQPVLDDAMNVVARLARD